MNKKTAGMLSIVVTVYLSLNSTVEATPILVMSSGSTQVSGSIFADYTAFQIPLFSGAKQQDSFNPKLGQLLDASLSISSKLLQNDFVSTPTIDGDVHHTTYEVKYPLLPKEFSISTSGGSYCPAAECTPGQVQSTIYEQTVAGIVEPVGGYIFGSVSAGTTIFQGSVTGTWSLDVQAEQFLRYEPFSTQTYLNNLTAEFGIGGYSPDLAELNKLAESVKELRELDVQTSGENLELRNLEYFLRGRIGAEILKSGEWDFSSIGSAFDDTANASGPIGSAIYIGLKYVNIGLGKNTAGASELPNTPPGGFDANWEGYKSGFLDTPLNEINLDAPSDAPPPSPPSYDPDRPLVPLGDLGPKDFGIFYVAEMSTDNFVYFDPPVQDFFSVGVEGNTISEFVLWSPLFSGTLNLFVDQEMYLYNPGTFFDFNSILGHPTLGFSIFGFPDELFGQDLIFGLRFADSNPTVVSAITGSISAIPEPETYAMLLAGLGLLGFMARRRKESAV